MKSLNTVKDFHRHIVRGDSQLSVFFKVYKWYTKDNRLTSFICFWKLSVQTAFIEKFQFKLLL